jgi:hypothetical protein
MRIPFPSPVRIAATLFAATAVSALAAPAPPPLAIDPDDFVGDHSQVEWSEAYLQWVASFPRGSSPISDTTGELCAARQDGDVWFLASSDGTAPVTRRCAIPAGKTLFVPITSTTERSGNIEPNCPTMAHIAEGTLTHVSQLSLTIDGQAVDNLERHRLATGDCFALGMRQVPHSAARTAVADGYYVMLAPLATGAHTLVVGARVDSTAISTTYQLIVR